MLLYLWMSYSNQDRIMVVIVDLLKIDSCTRFCKNIVPCLCRKIKVIIESDANFVYLHITCLLGLFITLNPWQCQKDTDNINTTTVWGYLQSYFLFDSFSLVSVFRFTQCNIGWFSCVVSSSTLHWFPFEDNHQRVATPSVCCNKTVLGPSGLASM